MNDQEKRAIAAACMLAALADGNDDPTELEALRRALARVQDEGLALEALWLDVRAGKKDVKRVAEELTSPAARELAYEMAVCTCDADGASGEKERAFLAELAAALGLSPASAERFRSEADALASAPVVPGTAAPAVRAAAAAVDDAELDRTILNQAILCGGLELLPQSLATLAILPLQMRLVYRIGKHYGFELDRGHVTDFLGVIGVGMASQMIEGFARSLARGLFGRVAGGFAGGLAGRASGSALSFGTTYALGHVAKRYYAGGRKLSAAELRELFTSLVSRSREVEGAHAAEIARSAKSVDVRNLAPLLLE